MLECLSPKNIGGTIYDIYSNRDKNITVYHANTGAREHILATLNKNLIVVATDNLQAQMLQSDLLEFGLRVDFLPEKEDTLYSKVSYNRSNLFNRIKVLNDLATGNVDVVTLSPLALMQLVPRVEELTRRAFSIAVEDIIKPDELATRLVDAGYTRVFNVENEGEFSLKGDVLDVYVGGDEYPIRISFFDELIESIKSYELVSIKPIKVLTKVEILPLSDILIADSDKDKLVEFLNNNRANGALSELVDKMLLKLNNNKSDYTLSWVMPLIKGMFTTLFDYIPQNYTIVFDDTNKVKEKLELYLLENKNRVQSMIESSSCLIEHKNNLLNLNALLYKLNAYVKLGFMPLQSQNLLFEPDYIYKLTSKPTVKYYLEPEMLMNDIRASKDANNLMILCADNIDRARILQNSLNEHDVFVDIVNEVPDKCGVYLMPLTIRKSIVYPLSRLYIVGTEDLLGKKSQSKRNKKRSISVIKEGDYVVHERHGIGLCEGVTKETINGVEKDYIVVGYKDNAKLYIAIEQMDLLTKYTGERPKISKLGGREFEKVKDRVKQSIKKMAFSLVELYRKRELTKGFKYSKDTIWQKEFEDSFEFIETPDQLQAISDVKKDMESGKVMDRLICGDVGFGKTEVAFRAMFKTIIDSKQAVLLAPTTILASQHYNNLKARLEPFKINIRLLSRLQSNAENKETIDMLQSGKVEIVVGTHRLLSKDVKFKNLGLLVLDEEQRFGVEQKERLKYIAENVNVLTLSATPIPRTLHMAMSGIRDINLLETPPTNRLPVETYIVEYDDNIVVDAASRELSRGGQVFILYNYVESIETYASHLMELLGNVNLTVAHGQMKPELLEERIEDFYSKRADILVCTTIIENGIDLPNANTLIVYDADKFGLSQLHQLRGRVGRSGKLAHAYFTTRKNKVLTGDASERLVALQEYSDFGSGYQIALKDLQIRGAGNILGREQHGHMEQVGYELYTKMLREAVSEITTGKVNEDVITEVRVDVDAYIDENLIPQEDKMALYNKISAVKTLFEANNLKNEILSMYGRVTDGISNMIDLSLIKTLANNIGVTSVVINKKAMGMEFGNVNVFKNPRIISAVSKYKDKCLLTDTTPIRVVFDGKLSEKEKIKLLIDFLQESN